MFDLYTKVHSYFYPQRNIDIAFNNVIAIFNNVIAMANSIINIDNELKNNVFKCLPFVLPIVFILSIKNVLYISKDVFVILFRIVFLIVCYLIINKGLSLN